MFIGGFVMMALISGLLSLVMISVISEFSIFKDEGFPGIVARLLAIVLIGTLLITFVCSVYMMIKLTIFS